MCILILSRIATAQAQSKTHGGEGFLKKCFIQILGLSEFTSLAILGSHAEGI